jgi:hypothetical protein
MLKLIYLTIIYLLIQENVLFGLVNINQTSVLDFGNINYTNQTIIINNSNKYNNIFIKESAKIHIDGQPNEEIKITFSPYIYKDNDGEFEIINNRLRENGKIFHLNNQGEIELEVIADLNIKNNNNLNGDYFGKINMSVNFTKRNLILSENIKAHFYIYTPPKDKKISDLDFGYIFSDNNKNCKITLNPFSNQRESNCAYVSGGYSLAKFIISATHLEKNNINIQGSRLTNNNGDKANALILNNIEYKLQKISNNEYTLDIGGTLLVQSKIKPGVYSSIYTLTINY